jgi:NAD(P)-dependent dehydrogenase (short-subunit alcohol dehydrogenase family)
VVLTDIDRERGQRSAEELDGIFLELDVRERERFAAVAEEVLSRFGRIDGLVNNAGINVKYEPLAMPEAEWDRCLDVNLNGQWNGCRAVLPAMMRQRAGSIVNIASVHGHQIIPRSFPYPVSKGGILALTRAIGVEYAPHHIRVNSISPGYIDTALLQAYYDSLPDPEAGRRSTEALIPMRRVARAEEVGMTAVFLLSDEAPYINATDIAIDGGGMALYHA